MPAREFVWFDLLRALQDAARSGLFSLWRADRRGATFCRICGHTIPQTPAIASPRDPEVPSPDSYVPRHLAEKILASRQSLEGERKQVTVLFADIRGSTSLLEGLDPEEAQKIIDPVLQVMMDAVHRYEGTVNQVLGTASWRFWRAVGARGPRLAGLLCRPGDAGGNAAVSQEPASLRNWDYKSALV